MPRNRTISASEALYVSTGSTATGYMLYSGGLSGVNSVVQLHRIQSANYSVSVQRQDVSQYGQIAPIDRLILEAPTVSLDFSYLVANVSNSQRLGFSCATPPNSVTDVGFISGILAKESDERNYFIHTVRGDVDAVLNADADSTKFTIGIGNAFISNWTAAGQVGGFATESVTVEGLNFKTYIGSTGDSPAIVASGGQLVSQPNKFVITTGLFVSPGFGGIRIGSAASGIANSVSAIRPGDITLSLPTQLLGPDVSDLKVQSYNISLPLSREPISKLGSPFPFSKEITFPIQITTSIEAVLGDLVTGDISQLFCNDASNEIRINLAKPQCGGGGPLAVQYKLVGAKLDSQSYSSAIGQNKTVSLQFTNNIGGPQDVSSNLFVSGTTF